MKLTPETIYTFKLSNGEEIVTKVILHNVADRVIEISQPMSVVANQQGVGMIASLFTADPGKKPQLNIDNIMIWAETEETVRTKYTETVTGIALPTKQMIMG